jgi:type VI protein secretion system component Hcp
MRRYRLTRCRATFGALLAGLASIAMLATAQSAGASIGPLELTGPSQTITIPTLYGVSQSINQSPSSAAYGIGGAPSSTSELSITAPVDEGPALAKALASGTHYKKGSLFLQKNGSPYEAICMSDAFVTSYKTGGRGDLPTESVSINYTKITFKYVKQESGASCNDVSSPPVESTLIGLNASGSKLTARLDCLTLRCRGILSVSLPNSACPAVASQSVQSSGKSACSYTGPVRVGLNGGKVSFNGDGTAFTGGVKVGIGGAGGFSMGDGSKRVLHLTVPPPLRKWLKGHSHATLGSIIIVRGLGRAIVEREVLDAPAKIYSGIPSLDETPPPAGPLEQPQSLLITQCSTLVVGTPTKVTVDGTLSPPRGGATVALTYTPVNPPPLPPAITDSVTTSAAGTFTDTFDRQVAGIPHSWSVVASIAAGGGYATATSPPCAIPAP